MVIILKNPRVDSPPRALVSAEKDPTVSKANQANQPYGRMKKRRMKKQRSHSTWKHRGGKEWLGIGAQQNRRRPGPSSSDISNDRAEGQAYGRRDR
jgi:hypothetical protein